MELQRPLIIHLMLHHLANLTTAGRVLDPWKGPCQRSSIEFKIGCCANKGTSRKTLHLSTTHAMEMHGMYEVFKKSWRILLVSKFTHTLDCNRWSALSLMWCWGLEGMNKASKASLTLKSFLMRDRGEGVLTWDANSGLGSCTEEILMIRRRWKPLAEL